MKYLDDVKVIVDKYSIEGVNKGDVGTVILAEIRKNQFEVAFTSKDGIDYACLPINIADLELIKDNGLTDDEILKDLPGNDKNWWCKVENGYILNLNGDKKNKVPYDYNS